MEKRTCKKCLVEQPIESFNRNCRSTGGRQWRCKDCEKRYRIENRERIARVQAANSERRRASDKKRSGMRKGSGWKPGPEVRKRWALKSKYGIDPEAFEQMMTTQGGQCGICQQMLAPKDAMTRANVDHCHKTGRVRGILCGRCNFGLGLFRDDVDRLKRAIEYLN